MGEKSGAFAKGGFGCLGAFLLVGALLLAIGGTVTLTPGGAVVLFVVGGVFGLICLWFFNKGKKSAED